MGWVGFDYGVLENSFGGGMVNLEGLEEERVFVVEVVWNKWNELGNRVRERGGKWWVVGVLVWESKGVG